MVERDDRRPFALAAERRQHILDVLFRNGKVLAAALSQELGVSEDTIRRDLRELAEAGQLQRVHGGALLRSPIPHAWQAREHRGMPEKDAIARAALRLIRNHQVIILDGSTTTLQVARHLPLELVATVITNSPPIALALSEHSGVEVVLIGGRLFKASLVTTGGAAMEALQRLRADLCLLGVCSLAPEHGISVPDQEESFIKRQMIQSSAEVAALVSGEKLGTVAPYIVAPVSELNYLVTEPGVADRQLLPYRELGVTPIQEREE